MKKMFLMLFALIFSLSAAEKIIFDTDMNGDVDDVGALAMLHGLADNGEAEILACMTSNPAVYVSECVDVINTYYGRPEIPIGALRGSSSDGMYTKVLADAFPHDAKRENLPEPVPLYREILAQQEQSSVTIVSVGFLPNLAQLLMSSPDEFSDLSGVELVAQKVKLWACMGGTFPSGKEYNLSNMYAEEAKYAIDNWPTPVIFTGWELGQMVMTGKKAHQYFKNSPVTVAYQRYYCSWAFDGNPYYAWENGHYSWDQTAVLIGVRGYEDYWNIVQEGYNAINEDGSNEWVTTENKNHAYITPKIPHEEVAALIDELINQGPIGAHFKASTLRGWMPLTVDFDASISNTGPNAITQFQWDLGNGDSSTDEQVSTVYENAGLYPVSLTISDDSGQNYNTTDSILVSDPLFGSDPFFGDATNYNPRNDALWSTQMDQGDMRYAVNDGRRNLDDSFDGYSFIKDSVYADFTFSLKVRSAEDWQENRSPDYYLVWGFADNANYTNVQMSARQSRIVNYSNGERVNFDRSLIPGMPDDGYHDIVISRSGDRVTLLVDGDIFADMQDPILAASGYIGFGAKNEAVYFDDINISRIATTIDVGKSETIPLNHSLENYPNPFNPQTTITLEIPKAVHLQLDIYNIAGQRVEVLKDEWMPAGTHRIDWNARHRTSGVFYAVLRAGELVMTRKMLYLR